MSGPTKKLDSLSKTRFRVKDAMTFLENVIGGDDLPGRDLIHDACDLDLIEAARSPGGHRWITRTGLRDLRDLVEDGSLSVRVAEAKRRLRLSESIMPAGRAYTLEQAIKHLGVGSEALASLPTYDGKFWHFDVVNYVMDGHGKIVVEVLDCEANDNRYYKWVAVEDVYERSDWRVEWPGKRLSGRVECVYR